MMRFVLVLVLVLGVVAFGTHHAAASPASKLHVDAGVTAYSAGDYETAIREFETAYSIDAEPMVLYAWAQANRLGKHCEDAVALYERYIQSKPTADQRQAAETGISLCEQQRPWPPKQGPVAPAQEPVPPARQPETEPANPVTSGTAADERRPWYSDRIAGVLTVGGVVAVGTGVTFLVLAGRSEDAAERASVRGDFTDLLDEATMRRRIGYTSVGVGAALVVAGVVRYVMQSRETRSNVAVTASGTSVIVFGRF